MSSIQKRPSGRWRARYEDPDGTERAQHFATKQAAVDFLATVTVRMRDGTWVDPQAGRLTFGDYAREWLTKQVHLRDSSVTTKAGILKNHLIPYFGERTLLSIQRSDVQAFVGTKTKTHAPATVEAHYTLLAQVLIAAVDDRKLVHSPCWKINLPELDDSGLVIPTVEEVAAVLAAAPAHAQAMILLGAGTGLRVSEMAGLAIDRIDFLRRTVRVDRQLVGVTAGQPRFGPPKTKAGVRTIPVPQSLIDVVAAHLAKHPSSDVVFRNAHNSPWRRQSLLEEWARWRSHAGYGKEFPWRGLRHHYASALIASGQSVKVVQNRLGHESAKTTLDIYSHLWPTDEDGTRTAVEGVTDAISRTADGLLAQKARSQA